jgi:hypothetical protein
METEAKRSNKGAKQTWRERNGSQRDQTDAKESETDSMGAEWMHRSETDAIGRKTQPRGARRSAGEQIGAQRVRNRETIPVDGNVENLIGGICQQNQQNFTRISVEPL